VRHKADLASLICRTRSDQTVVLKQKSRVELVRGYIWYLLTAANNSETAKAIGFKFNAYAYIVENKKYKIDQKKMRPTFKFHRFFNIYATTEARDFKFGEHPLYGLQFTNTGPNMSHVICL